MPEPTEGLDPTQAAILVRPLAGDGPLEVREHDQSGRNRLLAAEGGDGRSWIVKQNQAGLEAEVWFYRHAAEGFAAAPRCLHADAASRTVVLERLPEARNLEEISGNDPLGVLRLLPALAELLARLHGFEPDAPPPPAQCGLPELDPVEMYSLVTAAPAAVDLVRRVQARPRLGEVLRRARERRGPQGLVHGDLKTDNVLRSAGELYLIDWEQCGRGPVGWDLGAFLGSMLGLWIDGLEINEHGDIESWVANGSVPFRIVHQTACSSIEAYLRAAKDAPPDRVEVAVHVAAWMLGRLWAEATRGRRLTAQQLVRLVVAEALADRPEELFGEFEW